MVAVLWAVRLVDELVVLGKERIPLTRFAADEPVEAIESFLQGPLRLAPAAGHILFGHVVVFADPERAVAVVLKDLPDGGALRGEPRRRAGEAIGTFGDRGKAIHMMIATGQKAGPGGEHSAVVCHCE